MDDELLEQSEELVAENATTEPLIIETKGKWQPFEVMADVKLEVGKTYDINLAGQCQLMISKERPTLGFSTNHIAYTKDSENKLWIKTGG